MNPEMPTALYMEQGHIERKPTAIPDRLLEGKVCNDGKI